MGERNTRKSPVGVRLRQARLKKGISQKGLGILAGIDEFSASSRINQYERNKHVPDFSIAKRLARALGVPVTYLYADEDEVAELILLYAKAGRNMRARVGRILMRSDSTKKQIQTRATSSQNRSGLPSTIRRKTVGKRPLAP